MATNIELRLAQSSKGVYLCYEKDSELCQIWCPKAAEIFDKIARQLFKPFKYIDSEKLDSQRMAKDFTPVMGIKITDKEFQRLMDVLDKEILCNINQASKKFSQSTHLSDIAEWDETIEILNNMTEIRKNIAEYYKLRNGKTFSSDYKNYVLFLIK